MAVARWVDIGSVTAGCWRVRAYVLLTLGMLRTNAFRAFSSSLAVMAFIGLQLQPDSGGVSGYPVQCQRLLLSVTVGTSGSISCVFPSYFPADRCLYVSYHQIVPYWTAIVQHWLDLQSRFCRRYSWPSEINLWKHSMSKLLYLWLFWAVFLMRGLQGWFQIT